MGYRHECMFLYGLHDNNINNIRFFVEKHCERKEMHYKYICYKYCIIPNKRMLL